MQTNKAFGAALRKVRAAKGLTQEDFVMVSSRTYISTLERGLKSPTLDKVNDIAGVAGLHPLTILAMTYLNGMTSKSAAGLLAKIAAEVQAVLDE